MCLSAEAWGLQSPGDLLETMKEEKKQIEAKTLPWAGPGDAWTEIYTEDHIKGEIRGWRAETLKHSSALQQQLLKIETLSLSLSTLSSFFVWACCFMAPVKPE